MNLTLFIIIATSLVSITAFGQRLVFERMKFNPYQIRHQKNFYRFLSYGLLHVDYMHLLVNMFVLFSFGRNVENAMMAHFDSTGRIYFLLLYAGGLVFSVVPAYLKHRKNAYYNAVGASGAVSSVLFTSILMNPQSSIIILIFPFPIPAYVFGLLYLVYSAYMAKRGQDNIGHDVHFWGAIFGVIMVAVIDYSFILRFLEHVF